MKPPYSNQSTGKTKLKRNAREPAAPKIVILQISLEREGLVRARTQLTSGVWYLVLTVPHRADANDFLQDSR